MVVKIAAPGAKPSFCRSLLARCEDPWAAGQCQYIRSAGQCKPNRASLRSRGFEVWGRSPASPKEGALKVETTTISVGRIRCLDVSLWDAAGISAERLFAAALWVLISLLTIFKSQVNVQGLIFVAILVYLPNCLVASVWLL